MPANRLPPKKSTRLGKMSNPAFLPSTVHAAGREAILRVAKSCAASVLCFIRVNGLGFRGNGLGFRVNGLGFRVNGLGFRVRGLAENQAASSVIRPETLRFRVPGS